MIKNLNLKIFGVSSVLIVLLLSGNITTISSTENNGTINVRIGDQFIVDSFEYSFEYDDEYLSMIANSNETVTFTTLKTGNTTITHKIYPSGNIEVYNVNIRELTFTEWISKLIDDFFNTFNK
ncbi:MAG: hypothetical protein LBC39_04725 [Methanobrevibacter sp.]|nr:hypothetical protein [Candidatus Methanovirga aequatorialis]